jgi:ABC-type multidrug transport system fused ATPase/permease subunit
MAMLPALWRLLDHRQRRQLIGLQLLSVAMALCTVGGIAAVVPFFTTLADPKAIERSAVLQAISQRLHFSSEASFVIALGFAFVAMVMVANVVNLFGLLAINRFAFRVGDTLYVRLFDGYMRRDYDFHLQNSGSALATKVLHDTARVTSGLLQQGLLLVTNVVTIVCVVASIVLLNPWVAIAALTGLGASYAAIYIAARERLVRNGRVSLRHDAERTVTVNESFGAIKEILLAQGRDLFVERFAAQCRAISRAVFSTLAISQSPRYILECMTVTCLVSVALYFRSRTDGVGPWVAQLSFVGFAAYRLLPLLQQAFTSIVRIRAELPAFAGIDRDLRHVQPDEAVAPAATERRIWRGRPNKEICLRDVCFHYGANRPAAISTVSLAIPAGCVVGFMGPNGSGKTTLIDLISGLLTPQSGYIEVDGAVLHRGNRSSWQSTIAYVPQHAFLLDATLGENIALGIPPEQINRERLELAAHQARLTECIAALPNGFQERLGDRGCRLSGGQRQRLAIARALYRNASLLILDEATSALDGAAEGEIVEMLNSLRQNRTILVIAHRTTSLRYCDRIVELDGGRIARVGTYGQIMSPAKPLAATVR